MLKLTDEDAASIGEVLTVLEDQYARLGPASELRGVYDDLTDVLAGRPLPWAMPWDLPAPVATQT